MTKLTSRVRASRLYPVLMLEGWISRRARRLLLIVMQVALAGVLLTLILGGLGSIILDHSLLVGLILLLLVMLIKLYLIELYFRSHYYNSIISNNYQAADLFTFTVGRILYQALDGDLTRAFVLSQTGALVLRRLGITPAEGASFLQSRLARQDLDLDLELAGARPLTLRALADWLYANDSTFAKFLFRQQVSASDLHAAVDWVVADIEREARESRWWSREQLERVPGLAKDWSYGGTYTLNQYGEDLITAEQARGFRQAVSARSEEVKQLETILARSQEANALLVGPAGEGKLDVVWQLVNELKSGRVLPSLEHRRLLLLRTALLLADHRERQSFEQTTLKLLAEAERSGNTILVIDDLETLLAGADRLGSKLTPLLNPYLRSASLPVIALVGAAAYQKLLFEQAELLGLFEVVKIEEIDRSRLYRLLEHKVSELEKQGGVFFTYPAIKAIIESAERYFQDESQSDQSLDLLVELVPWAAARGLQTIEAEQVLVLVQEKTGIPLGAIGQAERATLVGLEKSLRAQIIGQESALVNISEALRRNRAGVSSWRKPIGSFLFLGPTGVGKTETAKALARTIFGREEALLRLDMSEYQSSDALNRLIGSFAENRPGILSTLLRENPYGVLLLDEFEKTSPEVLNLFLQILDEGFFSDAFGRRVSARNLILIATSNAMAESIWQMVQVGRDPSAARVELVNEMISRAVFRPEMLNRFDDISIFHPLSPLELHKVSKLLLERLVTRMRERGIGLQITGELVDRVAAAGADRVFGARPLNRYIQSEVEQKLADAIISGRLLPGMDVEFRGDKLILLS